MSDLSEEAVAEAAAHLAAARRGGPPLHRLPETCRPRTHRAAMAIQARVIAAEGGKVAGWKIGKSAKGPTCGAILASRVWQGPTAIPVPELVGFEAEIVFQIASPITAPLDAGSAVREVGAAFVGIELLHHDYVDFRKVSPLEIEADLGMNFGLVVGDRIADWQTRSLRTPLVRVVGDGALLFEREAAVLRDDPFEGLAWLANHLLDHGTRLEVGDYVATGTHVGLLPWQRGVAYEVRFEEMGEARFTGL